MQPLLEISIPTFNRPSQLRDNLPLLCRQASEIEKGLVSIRVLDNASTDPEVEQVLDQCVQDWACITVERNTSNLGLERNVTKCIMTTTGVFGLVPGDDDVFVQGGLRRMVGVLASVTDDTGLVIIDKHRVDSTSSRYIADIAGSKPDSARDGEAYRFESPSAFCAEVGPLSGLGLTSTAFFRSKPCRRIEAEKYLGLTVFPHVGIWLEAHAHAELQFLASKLMIQRTLPDELKLAEARGRREEKYMNRNTRDTHYLGVPYAAKLQRLIDAHALTLRDIRQFSERLLTGQKLVDYVRHLSRAAVELGLTFRSDVLADAIKFFDQLDRHLAAELRLMDETL